MKNRTADPDVKAYAIQYIQSTGSLDYTKHAIEDYIAKVKKDIAELGGNPVLEKLVEGAIKKVDIEDSIKNLQE